MPDRAVDRTILRGRSMILGGALLAISTCVPAEQVVAVDTSATALQQAQQRLRGADAELNRMKQRAAKAQKRVKDAEEAQREAARKAEEAKARLEQARSEQEAADAAVAPAQREYDQARTVIEEIYQARQGGVQ
jgi:chromosome segregation ATPase